MQNSKKMHLLLVQAISACYHSVQLEGAEDLHESHIRTICLIQSQSRMFLAYFNRYNNVASQICPWVFSFKGTALELVAKKISGLEIM